MYMDTSPDHFTPARAACAGNKQRVAVNYDLIIGFWINEDSDSRDSDNQGCTGV